MVPLEHAYADVNGVRLHYATAGHGKLILFVHGFPEFWYAWRDQLAEFGRDHQAVAVDMRGYNLSSKPEELAAYLLPALVEDLRSLADHLGHQRFVLVGHDWGGVVAWAFAMTHPERLEKLVIINAPHPLVFQRELQHNPAQQEASRYILRFQSPEVEQVLLMNDCAVLVEMVLGNDLRNGHLTEADRQAYLGAWTRPGALTGGLNYYRANRTGASAPPPAFRPGPIDVPTLVIWGMGDTALLPGNLDGLDQVVRKLTVERVTDADHWIVHQQPTRVNASIRAFLP
jgi:pimeloyl-ACP methyl ester carboxylesterase